MPVSFPKNNSLGKICEWQLFLPPAADEMEVAAYRTVITVLGSKEESWHNVKYNYRKTEEKSE